MTQMPLPDTYDFTSIEAKHQARWDANQVYKATPDPTREKFFCLGMLPYPSGKLHMGHVRNYTISDVIARYQRMLGKNVLQPMGWDAFGLPAENAAIKNKTPPAKWTYENIAHMKVQMKALGFAYDWDRELATCSPDYYRWEQWLFIQLFKKGMAYRKSALVNWDPVDQTVLANEQVVDGRGWRSGALVELREIPQWFLKITDYAEELLQDLDTVNWPLEVKTMQRHWIGMSEGLEITFPIEAASLTVYTTRADTLAGCTYLSIAPQHPLALEAARNNEPLAKFLEACSKHGVAEATIATLEKQGMDTGLRAINPLTGEELPIWVANFVLMDYGTGAVMSVPAHDERDHEFALKYDLPIKPVIATDDWDYQKAPFGPKGTIINSGALDGLDYTRALEALLPILGELARPTLNFRLRDWGISRQRYWGAPIPIIHCDDCGMVSVPEKDLPVVLPEDFTPDGSQSPLKTITTFYETTCPTCGKAAKRETDTFDTFIESSWYYARYTCPNSDDKILGGEAKYWLSVDQYVGGIEHAVMHLLYARFFHKVLRDLGFVETNEPFTRLLTQGMVLKDGAKMSKSKGNVVDPQSLIEQYGADTVRLFMMFATSPELSLEWSDAGVEGAHRFLKRVWGLAAALKNKTPSVSPLTGGGPKPEDIRRTLHQILQKANYDMERQQFNTVVSACMKLANCLQEIDLTGGENHRALYAEGLQMVLKLLAPIAPHVTAELWEQLGYGDILVASWPQVDPTALVSDTVQMVIQINGKLRASMSIAANLETSAIEKTALAHEKIAGYLADKTVRKVIVVPNKLVNIVLH